MDPLSIIASVIAVTQAIDRIATLAAKAKRYITAPEEIGALVHDVSDVGLVLAKLHSTTATFPNQELPTLKKLLDSCQNVMHQTERLINEVYVAPGSDDFSESRFRRVAWLRKKGEIDRLRQQLRDCKALLTLQLVGVNTSLQSQIAVALPQMNQLIIDAQIAQTGVRDGLERILERIEASVSEISSHFRQESTSFRLGRPVLPDLPQTWPRRALEASPNTDTASLTRFRTASLSCSNFCECRCHARTVLESSKWHTSFGSFSICTVGHPFQASTCETSTCQKRSIPLLSVIYYFPPWILGRAVGFIFMNGPTPTITLSFPSVVPPDAQIATCIRDGDTEQIKELFASGSASPGDIIGPYGITALSLAISYRQPEVCKLLVSVGAHEYIPNPTGRLSDAIDFWRKFHNHDYSIPTSVPILDMLNLCSTDRHLEAIHHSLCKPLQESEPFSRLHKSVMGITIEPTDQVIRESRLYINDTDLLGRTALHWAVCQLNANLVGRLLYGGADPDIKDRERKTPLHLAAGFGNIEVAAALVAAGANLELQDSIGSTALHLAAMQGHVSVLGLLLDAGSNIEFMNGFGETPLMTASLANQAHAVEFLIDRGCNMENLCCWQNTSLGYALKVNGYDVVQVLLRKQACSSIVLFNGKTLLHLAAESADVKMLELLGSSDIDGIDTEAVDKEGYTALDYLRLRPDRNAVLMPFEALVRHAGMKTNSAEAKSGEESPENDVEEFFDAVEFH